MLFAAVFSLVLRTLCRTPQLLGYVSTLTRDSIYFNNRGPGTTSAEDGPRKIKRLGKIRVMIGDVVGGEGKEPPGKIAFTPAEFGRRVRKGAWYD